jgi:hypothetical protein
LVEKPTDIYKIATNIDDTEQLSDTIIVVLMILLFAHGLVRDSLLKLFLTVEVCIRVSQYQGMASLLDLLLSRHF